jgi:hypothetical protein
LIKRKLSENLSMSYKKALKSYSLVLREQILKKDNVPIEFIDNICFYHTLIIQVSIQLEDILMF